jgi:uncharacterized protein YutE (UPF0331/DUF86 family)
VDVDRIQRLLGMLATTLDRLDAEADAGPERRADPLWLPGVEHLLVTAIQTAVDIARLLAAGSGEPVPDDEELMRLLARQHVVPAGLGDLLARAVRFRKILLTAYDQVDERIVAGRVHNLGDLREFWFAASRYAYGLG